ncbi:MAG: hypothetical protein MJZ15_03445 [Bacteroidales bacterium]|nr:hypothetical protein [Bacteroidales bacterium]
MRLTLTSHTPANIKRARHLFRHSNCRTNITVRNGRIYTMRYNPGVQPRTESQEKSWSLFKEANRLTTADFHNPSKKAYWQQKLKSQSRYKTARGLARAYYINLLRQRVSSRHADVKTATAFAASRLRPFFFSSSNLPSAPLRRHNSWSHYRNVHWFRHQLTSSV